MFYIDLLYLGSTPPANDDKGLESIPAKDEDPDGHKLLASPDPLERAAKLLSPLSSLAAENIDMWIAMYDVAIRRSKCEHCRDGFTIPILLSEKLLQAVLALNRAKSLDPEHPELHIRLVHCRLSGM